jgi:hypothetical protein
VAVQEVEVAAQEEVEVAAQEVEDEQHRDNND